MGKGLEIEWQDGPLGQGTDAREPNGTFVEDGLAAMRDRIDWYQTTAFACSENAAAIADLDSALGWLETRRADRRRRGVEGIHSQ